MSHIKAITFIYIYLTVYTAATTSVLFHLLMPCC